MISKKDPENIGRIIVECKRAKFGPENANWVLPMAYGAGAGGIYWPPEENTYVWIFFDNGDQTVPLSYMGGWWKPDGMDPEFQADADGSPQRRGFSTPAGHVICLDDTDGKEKITIRHTDGTIIEWTDDNKIRVGKDGGSFEPLVRGKAWKQWAETHTHPHSWGTTLPPTEPIPPDVLSDDTEIS